MSIFRILLFVFAVSVKVTNGQGFSNMCFQPPDTGSCRAFLPSYYFNTQTGSCDCFVYGGCNPGGNHFNSLQSCMQTCNVNQAVQVMSSECRRIFAGRNSVGSQQNVALPIATSTQFNQTSLNQLQAIFNKFANSQRADQQNIQSPQPQHFQSQTQVQQHQPQQNQPSFQQQQFQPQQKPSGQQFQPQQQPSGQQFRPQQQPSGQQFRPQQQPSGQQFRPQQQFQPQQQPFPQSFKPEQRPGQQFPSQQQPNRQVQPQRPPPQPTVVVLGPTRRPSSESSREAEKDRSFVPVFPPPLPGLKPKRPVASIAAQLVQRRQIQQQQELEQQLQETIRRQQELVQRQQREQQAQLEQQRQQQQHQHHRHNTGQVSANIVRPVGRTEGHVAIGRPVRISG